MANLSSSEIVDKVNHLIEDFAVLDAERRDGLDVYNLSKSPFLPPDMVREAQVDLLSDELRDATSVILSDILSFRTNIECAPTARDPNGAVPAAHKRLADAVEKADAIFLGRIHAGKRLKNRIIWRMCNEQLACVMLECYAIDEMDDLNHFPYAAYDMDLGGVGFTDIDLVPQELGWHYKRLAGAISKEYNRRDNPTGEGKSRLPVWDGKTWDWVSEDYDVTTSRNGEECEMYFYADENRLYHVGLEKSEHRVQIGPVGLFGMKPRKGEILWEGPNPFGRVPVVLYPGFESAQREVHLRFEPYLRPLKVATEKRNYEQTLRATRSRNLAAPQDYMPVDPETLKLLNGKLPESVMWEDGVTQYTYAEVKGRPIQPDPDLDQLSQDIREELERYRPSNLAQSMDLETAKSVAATAILAGLEAGGRRLSPVIGTLDSGDKQLLEMFHNTQKYYGDVFDFDWAAGAEGLYASKGLKEGDVAHLDRKTLDFPHEIRVVTQSKTKAQAIAEYQVAVEKMNPLPDGSPGVGTREDVMRAADITDVQAAQMQKAEELIMASADADIRAWAQMAIKEEILLGSDIDVDLMTSRMAALAAGVTAPLPGGGGQRSNAGILGNSVGSPVTNQVEGGSDGGLTQ